MVYVNIKELKIGCLVKIEGSQVLISMTHSMVDSKRCEKNLWVKFLFLEKLIKYLINSCFFTNKIDSRCRFCKNVRVETVNSHYFT